MTAKVSVIIVNYNAASVIHNCIQSVLNQENITNYLYEIIVVDNASVDNSLEVLHAFGERIQIIKNPTNVGFATANNIGFAHTTGEYIFLLNPDAVLTQPNDLLVLCNFMESHPDCGLVGPKISCRGSFTLPQKKYLGEKYLKKPLKSLPGKLAWVVGAAMFVRRNVYENIKGFDQDYFLYAEEMDLCLRIRRAGWTIEYDENVLIEHIAGVSSRQLSVKIHWKRLQTGAVLFYQKNYSPEDARYLIKRDRRIARWRLFLRAIFFNQQKKEKYEAITEVCDAALN